MMSSGFETCDYHTSHIQWLPGKAMKRNCNILWGSSAAKRSCLAEQLCQTITFSFSSWLFLHYSFFKHMMRTGTKDTGGNWQFEWIIILQNCFWVLRRDFYSGTSISPNLWQSSAYSKTSPVSRKVLPETFTSDFFECKSCRILIWTEKFCSSCIYPWKWCWIRALCQHRLSHTPSVTI